MLLNHFSTISSRPDAMRRARMLGRKRVAAAVILPRDYSNAELDDSKKLSARRRMRCASRS
jgi:hypothetical protein